MKKLSYMLSGVVIGVILMASSSAFADQIKSFVGKTVAGEYTVSVNGKALSEKAIVVDSKAHIPLRAVSDSLGAKVNVEGRTIEVTTNVDSIAAVVDDAIANKPSNPYVGQSKDGLLESRKIFVEKIIEPAKKTKSTLEERMITNQKNLELAEKETGTKFKEAVLDSIKTTQAELDSRITAIENAETQIKLIDEALALLEQK
ncbi:2,' 3'-cyclic nucleotide 2'-phosphodiesterase [Paenibacillus donghaensis]|uniref:Copper amine oxidase-like N-terminal domain-containing protein n=1 Tax=Paenibacillus donghaensis TaxID=414771 RepID=A0A2Z2KBD5_9BACL|nr:2,' 3'-cyclic nucleotide 2'-phosphodiesterase [Paenibacillus donghaensis]ASA20955.1 hypothetical protein B9T62_09255 [Paenibacillus donghaensis]